jgi:hypothetical protein
MPDHRRRRVTVWLTARQFLPSSTGRRTALPLFLQLFSSGTALA